MKRQLKQLNNKIISRSKNKKLKILYPTNFGEVIEINYLADELDVELTDENGDTIEIKT